MTTATQDIINGIDTSAVKALASKIEADPKAGMVGFRVTSNWAGGVKTRSRVSGWTMAGEEYAKSFEIMADEPPQLLGEDSAPNPQELIMSAMNSCMMVGYVAAASMEGVTLTSLEIQTEGELDLRGFLGLSEDVKPGNDEIRYTVTIKGDGTPEQYRAIHETVMKTSPNRWNIAQPVKLVPTLITD